MLPPLAKANLLARLWKKKDSTFGSFLAADLIVKSATGDAAEPISEEGAGAGEDVNTGSGGDALDDNGADVEGKNILCVWCLQLLLD